MFWMFRRLWPVLIAGLWLVVVVFQFRAGVVTWVLAPLVAAAGFLIYCAYLDERAPAIAGWLKLKTVVVMLGYTVFVLLLPQFPQLQRALTDRQNFEDVRLANSVQGCLSGMQAVISDYRLKLEDAQSAQIAKELDELAIAARTSPLSEEHRKREQSIMARMREIATSRKEWMELLDVCEPSSAAPPPPVATPVRLADSTAPADPRPGMGISALSDRPTKPAGPIPSAAVEPRPLDDLRMEYDSLASQVDAIQATLQQRAAGVGPLKPEISSAIDTARRDLASIQAAITNGDRNAAAARLKRVRDAVSYLNSL